MHIAIVGGGIAGLATYLHLRKHLPNPPPPAPPHTIHIYESHRPRARNEPSSSTAIPPSSTSNALETLSTSSTLVGGGLGVAPNGMRVLRTLDASIHARATAQGYPCAHFVFRGRNGWTLGVQATSDSGGNEGPGAGDEVCLSSRRQGVWEALWAAVGEEEGVVRYRRVVGVKDGEGEGSGVRKVVVFGDGGEDECDLVVGADGVRSVVRKGLFGEGEGEGRYGPFYTGISGVGGFADGPLPASVADNKAMVFTFGGNGFFGYSGGSTAPEGDLMWWSTFESDSLPSKSDLNVDEINAALKKRHSDWADPVIRDIVSQARVESIYPIWMVPPLPHWGENGIVLVGDAAHAMSPTTGQGVSQALEDAQTLALLLAETLKRAYAAGSTGTSWAGEEREAAAHTLKLFSEIRQPRVGAIAERGRKMDQGKRDVSMFEEYAMYCFLWVVNHFPSLGKLMMGDVNAELNGWSAKREVEEAMAKLDSASF